MLEKYLPFETTQQIFRALLNDCPVSYTVEEYRELRLVCRDWNRSITSTPIWCRVHITSVKTRPEKTAITPMVLNPYRHPLVANCYHKTHADVFVQIDVPKRLWTNFKTLDHLNDYLKKTIGSLIGFSSIKISDLIANAANCRPIKSFIEVYEDSDENCGAIRMDNGGPPIGLYRALRLVNFGFIPVEMEILELQLMYYPSDDSMDSTFAACRNLECLHLSSRRCDIPGDILQRCPPTLKHVSFEGLDHLLLLEKVSDLPFKLETIGLYLTGLGTTSLDYFLSLVREGPSFWEALCNLWAVVMVPPDNDIPNHNQKTTFDSDESSMEAFETLKMIPSLRQVLMVDVGNRERWVTKLRLFEQTFTVVVEY